jgi:TFIIF-interacting CTD phosphatase-like protein
MKMIINFVDTDQKFYVKKKPYLDEFLLRMSQYFKIVIYCSSDRDYCEQVVHQMDSQGILNLLNLIQRSYSRDFFRTSIFKKRWGV